MTDHSILDFKVVQPGYESVGPEPTLRVLVHNYYATYFATEKAVAFAGEYIRQIEIGKGK